MMITIVTIDTINTIDTASMATLLDLIASKTSYVYRRKTLAGEYAGPCPFCQAGEDRFRIWPHEGRYWCRFCDRKGDAIQFYREYMGMSFHEAQQEAAMITTDKGINHINDVNRVNDINRVNHRLSEPQDPPTEAWQVSAWAFKYECQQLLHSPEGARARAWLLRRGITEQTMWAYGLGLNPDDRYDTRSAWGLDLDYTAGGKLKGIWLPRGITIPWVVDGDIWGIRIRRPVGDPKYYWIPGGTPGLFNATGIVASMPTVLVEGEFDAMTIDQAVKDLVTPVATGSTHSARRVRWLARLQLAPLVLVAYDCDEAGEDASKYWCDALSNARRWRPYWSDVNAMHVDGTDVRAWVTAGMQQCQVQAVTA